MSGLAASKLSMICLIAFSRASLFMACQNLISILFWAGTPAFTGPLTSVILIMARRHTAIKRGERLTIFETPFTKTEHQNISLQAVAQVFVVNILTRESHY